MDSTPTTTPTNDPSSNGGKLPSTARPSARRAPSIVSIAVFLVLAVFVVGTFYLRRGAVEDDERERLEQRADDVQGYMATLVSTITASLDVLGDLYVVTDGDREVFTAVATTQLALPGRTIAAVERGPNGYVAVAGTGQAGELPAPLAAADLNALVDEALASRSLAATVREAPDGSRELLVAETTDGAEPVIVVTVPLGPPGGSSGDSSDGESGDDGSGEGSDDDASDDDQLFGDVWFAVYAGDPDAGAPTVIATEQLPSGSLQAVRELDIGPQQWVIAVSPRGHLLGDSAYDLPALILAVGLIVAALAAVLVEVTTRRRLYAEAMVAQRTADLESAMVEIQRARHAAEDANRAKDEFLSRMSHELRTPLNAVLGFNQMLQLEDLTEEQRDATDHIMKAGRHLLELIDDVLDLSRIESGTMSLSIEPVLMSDVIDDAVHLVQPMADEAGINLVSDVHETCRHYVEADRQRLRQVLLNLLTNAVKYNRVKGSVHVSCEPGAEGKLRLCVRDTGPGIRPEMLERLFTPFERLGAEGTDVEGIGIGLSLSKRLAEAMGGSLGATSTVGRGSTFWCELPEAESPVERHERMSPPTETRPAPAPRTGARTTVLLIEDNLSNVTLIERILAKHDAGIEVVSAMQGELGLELARQHQPQLVLLDLHLPDVDGGTVLRRLVNDPITAATPVVVVSADATPSQVKRMLEAGAAGYLTKPIDVKELLRLVDELIPS